MIDFIVYTLQGDVLERTAEGTNAVATLVRDEGYKIIRIVNK
jgi:hypothetical protein